MSHYRHKEVVLVALKGVQNAQAPFRSPRDREGRILSRAQRTIVSCSAAVQSTAWRYMRMVPAIWWVDCGPAQRRTWVMTRGSQIHAPYRYITVAQDRHAQHAAACHGRMLCTRAMQKAVLWWSTQ